MSNVLIVDDDSILRKLLIQILEPLEERGVEVTMAKNGEAALEKIRDERPKVVLLDIMMPKISGFDVCSNVKKDPELKNTFIIILTARGEEKDRQMAKELGADCYLTKPFDPDELMKKVTEILGVSIQEKPEPGN
jgi:two-component system, OmpR family, alkaline phosphatase synthesis response regulator PhoP